MSKTKKNIVLALSLLVAIVVCGQAEANNEYELCLGECAQDREQKEYECEDERDGCQDEAQEYLVDVVQPLQFACANTPADPQVPAGPVASICLAAYYASSNHQSWVQDCLSEYGRCRAEAREEEIDCIQSTCVGLGG